RWRYSGTSAARLSSANGDLVLDLPSDAVLTERAPVAWQETSRGRSPVEAHYSLNSDSTISFALGEYNHALPLVIDPTLIYSTYLGGTAEDRGNAIAVDGSGNAYITGYTFSATLFPLQNAYDNMVGAQDAFVTKLSSSGALVYSTYLGSDNT